MKQIDIPMLDNSGSPSTGHGCLPGAERSRTTLVLDAVFLLGALALLFFPFSGGDRELFGSFAISFVSLLLEAMPFMLIGALAGGVIEVFVPRELLSRVLAGRRLAAVFLAAAMGAVLPVCECAIVPVVRRLLRKGVPFPAALAFLLAGPIVNPIVAGSTAVAYSFDLQVVATRLLCGYGIAVGVALVMGRLFRGSSALVVAVHHEKVTCGCCGHDHKPFVAGAAAKLGDALRHAADDFFEVGKFLVIGGFIAAAMRTFVAVGTFQALSSSPWLAVLLMMALAVALNLCSEADAFIAASFRGVLPGSAQMAFMVLGPMFDLKLLLMYLTVFRKRAIVALSSLVVLAVLGVSLFLEYVVGGGG